MVVQIALKLALDVLNGTSKPSKAMTVPVPMLLYTSGTPAFKPAQNPANLGIDQIVVGKNCYPQLAPGLALPFTLPQYHITQPPRPASSGAFHPLNGNRRWVP